MRVKTAQTTPIALDGVTEGSEYTLTVTGRQSGKAVTVDFKAPAANSADKNNGKPGAGNADKNGVIASGKVNNDTKAGPFGAALLSRRWHGAGCGCCDRHAGCRRDAHQDREGPAGLTADWLNNLR